MINGTELGLPNGVLALVFVGLDLASCEHHITAILIIHWCRHDARFMEMHLITSASNAIVPIQHFPSFSKQLLAKQEYLTFCLHILSQLFSSPQSLVTLIAGPSILQIFFPPLTWLGLLIWGQLSQASPTPSLSLSFWSWLGILWQLSKRFLIPENTWCQSKWLLKFSKYYSFFQNGYITALLFSYTQCLWLVTWDMVQDCLINPNCTSFLFFSTHHLRKVRSIKLRALLCVPFNHVHPIVSNSLTLQFTPTDTFCPLLPVYLKGPEMFSLLKPTQQWE